MLNSCTVRVRFWIPIFGPHTRSFFQSTAHRPPLWRCNWKWCGLSSQEMITNVTLRIPLPFMTLDLSAFCVFPPIMRIIRKPRVSLLLKFCCSLQIHTRYSKYLCIKNYKIWKDRTSRSFLKKVLGNFHPENFHPDECHPGKLPSGRLPPGRLPPRKIATQENCHPGRLPPRKIATRKITTRGINCH